MQFLVFVALLFLVAFILTAIKIWERQDIEENTKLL